MASRLGKAVYQTKAWRILRREVLDRDGWRCTRCGARGRLDVHHKVPLAAGGTNELRNLTALCRGCHYGATAKQNRRHTPDPGWEAALKLIAEGA